MSAEPRSKPICPECGDRPHETRYEQAAGATFDVAYRYDAFWDADGSWHRHDYSPVYDSQFSCSNGHKWSVPNPQHSCWCGWPESGQDPTVYRGMGARLRFEGLNDYVSMGSLILAPQCFTTIEEAHTVSNIGDRPSPDYRHLNEVSRAARLESRKRMQARESQAEPSPRLEQAPEISPRLVLIEWSDAFGCSPHWTELSELAGSPQPVSARSVGWLVHDGEGHKVIVPHLTEETARTLAQGCGDMTIPMQAITRMVDLAEVVGPGKVRANVELPESSAPPGEGLTGGASNFAHGDS